MVVNSALCSASSDLSACHRVQNGTVHKLHAEKNLDFYPCGLSLLGSSMNKFSYLVSSRCRDLETCTKDW